MITAVSADGVSHQFPDGTPPSVIDGAMKKYVSQPKSDNVIESTVRAAAQGATFNLADEISAGMDAVTQPILKRGSSASSIGERYDANLKAERDRDAADASAHPVADIAGNIAGSVAGPGKLIDGAKGAISLIKQGTAMGAIYGFGAGEGGFTNRAESAVEGAAIGGATSAAVGGATKIFNKVRPSNISADFTNRQFAKSPMAAESEQLSQDLGQTYTPGQATGSKGLLTIEGLVRRHPVSADTMADFDAKQMDRSVTNLVQNLDQLHANPSGPEATGNLVSKAFDDVVSKAVTVRRATAKADFGAVDDLVASEKGRLFDQAQQKHDADVQSILQKRQSDLAASRASANKQAAKGGAVMAPQVDMTKLPEPPTLAQKIGVIAPKNLSAEIDNIVNTFGAPGGGDASAALVARAKRLKASLPKDGGMLGATESQRLLQIYGDAARGTGAIFKDLDTGQQRMIAGRLKDALLKDMDEAVDNGGLSGKIATALKTARDNYRSNSKAIDDLGDSVLGRMFGSGYQKAPERVAQAMRNMQPSELRQSLGILNKADPQTSQSVKRFLVEDAMSAAGSNPKSGAPQPRIGGEDVFSAPKFLTAIRKSPVWGSFTPVERQGMETAVRDLERVAYRGGTDGSPTAPLLFAWEVAKAMGGGALALNPTQIAKIAASVLVPNKIAKVITTPEGQRALRTVRLAKPNTPAALAATSALVGMFVGKDAEPDQGGAK